MVMGQLQNGNAVTALGCMRVARHDHMTTSHVVSNQIQLVIGRGVLHWFCRLPAACCATALLKRGPYSRGHLLIWIDVKVS